jgi:hypothetical protein
MNEHSTIASRLSPRVSGDSKALVKFIQNSKSLQKPLLEDLFLHDKIFIPISNYVTVLGFVFAIGERGLIELLESNRLTFIRTRGSIAFHQDGKHAGGLGTLDSNAETPSNAPLESAIKLSLSGFDARFSEKSLLSKLLLENSINIETSEIVNTIAAETIIDFRNSPNWKKSYRILSENSIFIPRLMENQIIFPGDKRPQNDPISALLAIASYNQDIYFANKFNANNTSTAFPIGNFLRLKSSDSVSKTEPLWSLFEINSIPDFAEIDLDNQLMKKLNKATTSQNAKTFRHWFHSQQTWSEKDLFKEYISIVNEVPTIQKLPTRILRFLVTTAFGFVPAVGTAVSVFDSFFMDRALQQKSPKFFINDLKQLSLKEKFR